MRSTRIATSLIASIACSVLILTLLISPKTAHAETANDFNAGHIIDDSVFTNSNSMAPIDIQNFLNSKVPNCDTNGTQPASDFGRPDLTHAQYAAAVGWPGPPYTCLRNYTENGLAAAQIIYNTAQYYAINPQVLIVLLQKEQGLVTDNWPLPSQYRTATGYGCPDTAACSSTYYGFTNQVNWAARMFRAILDGSSTWYSPYLLGYNTIQWNPNSACGSSTVYIENRSTQALYDYTPYRPNQAALNAGYGMGDSCSSYGNRNFYLYFRDWFGYHSGPAAFKSSSSDTVYVPVDGYKMSVPNIAVLQDYGISTAAIQTVSQSYVDSIPTPPSTTGFSANISYIIKSPSDTDEDGASVYLVSLGKRYHIQTMQQLANFGFTSADIAYLPLSYIQTMSDGGDLSNFVTSPYGPVFENTGTKQIIFQYSTYIARNPSNHITPLSYFLVNKIPSGTPITDNPVLVKNAGNDTISLYINGTYYSIPNYNTYTCWGFDGPSGVPLYEIPQSDYIASFTPQSALGCYVNDGSSNQVVNHTQRLAVPAGVGLTNPITLTADEVGVLHALPLRSSSLKSYIKPTDDISVWYAANGTKRLVPTYSNFTLLGLHDSDIDTVSPDIVNQLTSAGIQLGNGQLVKDAASSAVYGISNNSRVLYPTGDLFLAYHNNWGTIETYTTSQLDQYYPYQNNNVSETLANTTTSTAYLVGSNGCFTLDNTFYSASGLSYSTIASSQSYSPSLFPQLNLASCASSSEFIQQTGQNLVYWIDNGQKHALTTYSALLAKNNGSLPTIMQTSSNFLSKIPTGSSY